MRILVTGKGSGGSFEIRGRQLGEAIGADVIPKAPDVRGYDLAVVVKKADNDLLLRLHKSGVPIIYDIVDAWPQPVMNDRSERECMHWLHNHILSFQPVAIVAATNAMALDCQKIFDGPVLALPHHARPGIQKNPIRPEIMTVGYEGGPQYIDRWRIHIDRICAKRGWKFVINPPSLSDLDVVLCLRDQGGYAPRHWKSNVKLANAQGSGTPCILSPESGYLETACGKEIFINTPDELLIALDYLTHQEVRCEASQHLAHAAPKIEDIARTYSGWLHWVRDHH